MKKKQYICNEAPNCQNAKDDPGMHCQPHEWSKLCDYQCPRIKPSKCIEYEEDGDGKKESSEE